MDEAVRNNEVTLLNQPLQILLIGIIIAVAFVSNALVINNVCQVSANVIRLMIEKKHAAVCL